MGKIQRNIYSSILTMIRKGIITAACFTITSCMLSAWMITRGTWGEEKLAYIAAFSIVIGTFLGGLIGLWNIGEKRLIYGILIGAAYFLLQIVFGMLLFEGSFQNVVVTGLLSIGGSVAAGMAGFGGKTQPKNRKRK